MTQVPEIAQGIGREAKKKAEYKFSQDWFTMHIPVWQEVFKPIMGMPNLLGLEIGSFEGRSTIWLLDNVLYGDESSIYCVDQWEGSPEIDKKQLYEAENIFLHNISVNPRHMDKVFVFKGSSKDKLKKFKEDYFDFIYVDGSHHPLDVLRDGVLAWELLKDGGLMLFDDYIFDRQTKKSIDSFLIAYRDEIHIIKLGRQAIVQKRTRA